MSTAITDDYAKDCEQEQSDFLSLLPWTFVHLIYIVTIKGNMRVYKEVVCQWPPYGTSFPKEKVSLLGKLVPKGDYWQTIPSSTCIFLLTS